MYISIFCIYEFRIDAKALYDELSEYRMNVTELDKTIFVYGRIDVLFLPEVIYTLIKYGDAKITISK